MKLIHISDLHLGKRLHEYSMIEDQRYILRQITDIIDDVRPDAVVIAGDVYDKAIPSAEAVSLFDDFLVALSARRLQVFVISGNHDSAERTSFGGRLMDASGIHLAPVYDGNVAPVTLTDEFGHVNIYMLPFIRPVNVRQFFPGEAIGSYTDALKVAVDSMKVNAAERNVIVTHQFVTGAETAGSEEITVGGTDNVSASVFDSFDYVALGHIHGAQDMAESRVRYCGTPLKYSLSELNQEKSVSVVTLGAKGDLSITTVPLVPKHDLREVRGTFDELTKRSFYEKDNLQNDYVHVILTDEDDVPNAQGILRQVYPYFLCIDYDNRRTRAAGAVIGGPSVESKSPQQLFSELFEKQNGRPLSEEEAAYIDAIVKELQEAEQ